MGRINVRDEFIRDTFGSLKMRKLKGHVRLELHNCRTGKTIVEEGDNTVTYAIRDILANNLMSALNVGSLAPIWSNWYGGVLCYKQAHPLVNGQLDPSDYFIRGNNVQELTAHAGPNAPSDYSDDLKRGSPNTAVQVLTENSVKQGWEWGSSQGNGVIGALSLCHKDVGDCGTGAVSTAFANFQPFESVGNLSNATINVNCPDDMFAMYDDNHSLWFHIGDVDEYYRGHTSFTTKKLTIIIRRLPYKNVGLYETMVARTDYPRTFVVEISDFNFYNQPSYYFDYENKKLWVFTNTTRPTDGNNTQTYDNQTVHYAIIDCETESIDSEGTIVSDTSDLAPVAMEKYPNRSFYSDTSRMRNANIIKDGNYVYFPTTNGVDWGNGTGGISKFNVKGLKKINISNQSDQSTISYNAIQDQFKSAFLCGGLIINSGRVVNGGVGYSCASQLSEAEAIPCYAVHTPNKISSIITYLGAGGDSASQPRYLYANKLVNTTLFNLDSAQTKTATQSMTVTYTLTEQSAE